MYSRLFTSYEAQFLSPALVEAAQRSKVKMAFHLDHGASDEAVVRALRYGCTSVMRDASELPFEENVEVMKRIVHMAHDVGVDVEGELGHIGLAQEVCLRNILGWTRRSRSYRNRRRRTGHFGRHRSRTV